MQLGIGAAALLGLLGRFRNCKGHSARFRLIALDGFYAGFATVLPERMNFRQVSFDLKRQFLTLHRVVHQFQFFFFNVICAQQVDGAHEGCQFGLPDGLPGISAQMHRLPEPRGPRFAIQQGLAFPLMLAEQRLEFLGCRLERDREFRHETQESG